jgi:GR25 family glycosyltransferase involved in LPS biosynthesis
MHILGSQKDQGRCAITVEHVDIWHDIVTRNSSLSLILEDDAVFVSHFREKFDRTIYTAIRTGALKIGGLTHCIKDKPRLSNNSNEWYEQDPMIVIGGCIQIHDHNFEKNRRNVPPMLSTHKAEVTRCTHAYLLTACSAQALLRQITAQKNRFLPIDHMLNELATASPTIQSFWLDPPIVYQGNQTNDFDGIPSFAKTTYWSK